MAHSALRAVHDDDLVGLLEKLDLKEQFDRGELRCRFCEDVISWDNLHALFPESGTIRVVCDKKDCRHRMVQKLDHNLQVS